LVVRPIASHTQHGDHPRSLSIDALSLKAGPNGIFGPAAQRP
jgi:hypothetical protein